MTTFGDDLYCKNLHYKFLVPEAGTTPPGAPQDLQSVLNTGAGGTATGDITLTGKITATSGQFNGELNMTGADNTKNNIAGCNQITTDKLSATAMEGDLNMATHKITGTGVGLALDFTTAAITGVNDITATQYKGIYKKFLGVIATAGGGAGTSYDSLALGSERNVFIKLPVLTGVPKATSISFTTTLTRGTIDDPAIMPQLHCYNGSSFVVANSFNLFNPSDNTTMTWHLEATDTNNITVDQYMFLSLPDVTLT